MQVIAESVKVLKVLEKKRDVRFNLDYQLLGGVRSYLQAFAFSSFFISVFQSSFFLFDSPPSLFFFFWN